jgi:hypothetical protein
VQSRPDPTAERGKPTDEETSVTAVVHEGLRQISVEDVRDVRIERPTDVRRAGDRTVFTLGAFIGPSSARCGVTG